MTVKEIRSKFPILSIKNYGKDLVYFDNAATSQRPESVFSKWNELVLSKNGNIHRAVHKLAECATAEYELARDKVKDFINAKSREEIIFTSGTTESVNLAAFCFGEAFVKEGDEIIVAESEHHSDIIPWQMMCNRKKAVLKVLKVDDTGRLQIETIPSLLSSRTRLLAVAHISNVLGLINPISEIIGMCHSRGVPVFIDGAQGIVHEKVDVQELDCDFYTFSGHKMYAATGTGVLYGKRELLDKMPPFMGGGEMISSVSFEHTEYAGLPAKFEAGTPDFNAMPTFVPAIDILNLMNDQEIENSYKKVKEYLYEALIGDDRIKLFGTVEDISDKIPLFSIVVNNAHHEDVALILDKMGIAVRSGQMCAEPLMNRFGVTGMLRLSLAPYNTIDEAEYFIKSLDKAIKMLV